MEHSATISQLADALSKAQAEFQPAKKDTENPFFKSQYADLASIFEVVRPVAGKYGLSCAQFPSINYERKTSIVTTILMHKSGEWIKDSLELPVAKFDAQGIGSAVTYGRRYGLQSAYGIAAEEDDDGNRATHDRDQPKKQAKAEQPAKQPEPKTSNATIRGFVNGDVKQTDDGLWFHVDKELVFLPHEIDRKGLSLNDECELRIERNLTRNKKTPYCRVEAVLSVVPSVEQASA